MNGYSLYGKLLAQPGSGEQLQGYLLEAARQMKQLPDCLCYIVGVSPQEPDHVYVYEAWTSEAAHDAALTMEVFQELIQRAGPLILGMEDQVPLTILGGKIGHQ